MRLHRRARADQPAVPQRAEDARTNRDHHDNADQRATPAMAPPTAPSAVAAERTSSSACARVTSGQSVIVSAPFAQSRHTGGRLDLFAKSLVLRGQHPDVLFVDFDVLA